MGNQRGTTQLLKLAKGTAQPDALDQIASNIRSLCAVIGIQREQALSDLLSMAREPWEPLYQDERAEVAQAARDFVVWDDCLTGYRSILADAEDG